MQIKDLNSDKAILVIMDGYGISTDEYKNAIINAKTPTISGIFNNYPYTLLEASGEAVGLPKGIMGNSEVGHMNIGSGRAIIQDLVKINSSMKTNKLIKKIELVSFINKSESIHLMGLLSDGGVHSHIDHIEYLINNISKEYPNKKIFFHAFMDGRDTSEKEGINFLNRILKLNNKFIFASMMGRSIAMDRDRRWEKIELSINTLLGDGKINKIDPISYIKKSYDDGITDEFIEPVLFNKEYRINKNDGIFFINFRPDRASELTLAFTNSGFNEFKTKYTIDNFLCMTPYVEDLISLPILFNKDKLKNTLSEHLSSLEVKQFKISETEKYAHVTYFFNGGRKTPFKNEDHFLIPSPKDVKTYDLKPEMSAYLITEKLKEVIRSNEYQFIVVNYANSDMVGHTGNYKAAIKAIEALDRCILNIKNICEEMNYSMVLTADHGNSDQMIYPNGDIHTSHTKAKVPFAIFNKELYQKKLKEDGNHALKDIAPTICNLIKVNNNSKFEGKSIFL